MADISKIFKMQNCSSNGDLSLCQILCLSLLSLPNNVWRLIVFAPFLIIIKSPKQSLRDLLFLLRFLLLFSFSFSFLSADHELVHSRSQELTEFHETLWSYRYMFLVGPKVFSFVVKGVKVIFWGVQRGWVLLLIPMRKLKFRTLMLITSKWIMIET